MPEHLRAHREGIDRFLQQVVAGVADDKGGVNLDREDLSILLDALPVAVLVSSDRACSRIYGNAAARQLYQLPDNQNLSLTAPADELPPFEIYADGKPAKAEDLPLQRAARTGLPVAQSECEIRFADGRSLFIAGHSIPIRNDYGEICGSVGAFLDLTPHRRQLETLQVVSKELSHRLKNTISIIQAISHRTLKPVLDAAVFETYESRLMALARYQDLLHAHDWKTATLAQVAGLAVAGLAPAAAARLSLAGPDLDIPAEMALTLSMIMHELTTNALKYGALSGAEGAVAITWETQAQGDGEAVRLTWVESGGPAPAAETQRSDGFGTGMMTAVAKSLPNGKLDLHLGPAGLVAALAFKVRSSRAAMDA